MKTIILTFAQGFMPSGIGFSTKSRASSVTVLLSFPAVTQCLSEVTNINVGKGGAGLHVYNKFLALEALCHLYLMPAISPFPSTNGHSPKHQ